MKFKGDDSYLKEREELFNEWKNFTKRFYNVFMTISHLKEIVQNPGNIDEKSVKEWREISLNNWVTFKEVAEQFLIDYKDLTKRTLDHVRVKKYDVYIHPESESAWYEEASFQNKYADKDPCVELYSWSLNEEDAKEEVKELEKKGYNVDDKRAITCKDSHQIISEFVEKYTFLSNFYYSEIKYQDKIYKTSEHLYQSLKTLNTEEQEMIRMCYNPSDAKKAGRKVNIRNDWDSIKDNTMMMCLKLKFNQNQILQKKLIDTYPALLIETNYWHDNYWGNCICKRCQDIEGINTLGKLLMKLRDFYMDKEFISKDSKKEAVEEIINTLRTMR